MKILLHSKFLILFSLSILFGHSALAQTITTPEPTDQYICIDTIGTYSVFGFSESTIDWYVKEKSEAVAIDNMTLTSGAAGEYVLGSFNYKWKSSSPSNYVENTTYTLQLEETSVLGSCVSERKSLNVHLLARPKIDVSFTPIAACSTDKSTITVSMTPSVSSFPTIVKYQYRLRQGTTILHDYQFSNQFENIPASGTDYNIDSRYVVSVGENVIYVVRGSFVSTTISVVEEADTTPPTAVCQDITVELDASGTASITAAQINNGSSDNCGIASMSLSKTDFDCDDISTNQVVESTDGYSVSINVWPISVNPDRDPCVSGYNYTVTLGYDISFSGSKIPDHLYTLQGTLGCGGFFQLPNEGGSGTVETANAWRKTPDCATITPEILGCTDVSIQIQGPGISDQTIPLSLSSPNTVELTVVDNSGNTSTCTANVTVEDNIAPTASNPADISVQCKGDIPAADITVVADAADNCSTPTVAFVSDSDNGGAGTTTSPYIVTRTYSVSDASGNSINVVQLITAIDDVNPDTPVCQANIDHVLYCNRTAVTINIPNPTDNCNLESLTYNVDSGAESANLLSDAGSTVTIDLGTAGDHTITWTTTDVNTNTSNCNFTIHVDTEPVINIVTATNTTCETSSDGQISIRDISIESGSIVEYSIDNGTSWQVSNEFTGLSAATYQVKIRTEVGGQYCESETKSVTVNSPTAITISKSNLADASCAGNADGEIGIAVSGGDQAMHFDGSNYVALDLNYNSTTAIPEMTVAAWVKVGPNSGGGNWAILDFDRSDYFNFTIGSSYSDYNVSFNTKSSSGGIHDFNSTTTIGDDQWHFVVGVYNSTGKYIYIDGELDNSTSAHSGAALGSSNTRYAFIGDGSEASVFDGNRNKKYFKGNITDVWYFESAISDTDALQELSNGIVPAGHTATGHWDLNDVSNEYIANLVNPNSYGQIFGMDNSNIADANIYTFTCTKDGVAISLDGILSEESTGNYKLVDLEAGDYVLTVTDNNGCSATTSFTIGEPEELDINLTANNNLICEGELVEITATCSGGTAAYTYEFYLNGSSTPLTSGTDYTISENKLTSRVFNDGDEITVKVIDNNSCEKVSDKVIVTVHDLPIPTISGALSVCAEDPETPLDPDLINTEIYFTETGMSNYNWTVTGGTIEAGDGTNEITVKWKTAGTGTVSVNYENTNGCSATSAKSETITIYERPNPSSIFPDN